MNKKLTLLILTIITQNSVIPKNSSPDIETELDRHFIPFLTADEFIKAHNIQRALEKNRENSVQIFHEPEKNLICFEVTNNTLPAKECIDRERLAKLITQAIIHAATEEKTEILSKRLSALLIQTIDGKIEINQQEQSQSVRFLHPRFTAVKEEDLVNKTTHGSVTTPGIKAEFRKTPETFDAIIESTNGRAQLHIDREQQSFEASAENTSEETSLCIQGTSDEYLNLQAKNPEGNTALKLTPSQLDPSFETRTETVEIHATRIPETATIHNFSATMTRK